MAVMPRTSSTRMSTPFMSSKARTTRSFSSSGCIFLPRLIAMGIQYQRAHRLWHEITQLAAGGRGLAHPGGGNLQLRDRLQEQLARGLRHVYIGGAARAHFLREWTLRDQRPARPVGHHHVGQLEEFAPALPAWKSKKRVHAH